MKIEKILLIVLLSLTKLVACGNSEYISVFVKDNNYDFLDASLIGMKEENPLYKLTKNRVYGYGERVEYFHKKSRELNLKEWQNYFNNKLTFKDLEALFYSENTSLEKSYAIYSSKIKNSAFKKYFYYMADQQIYAQGYENVKTSSKVLISRGVKALDAEKDKFLKLRYLFLVMRLNHYSKNYADTLALYNTYYDEVKEVDSLVFEWIDALRAGALQHLGKMWSRTYSMERF